MLKPSEQLVYPFPITRKVDHENFFRLELKKRKSSMDVISPLQADYINTIIAKAADGKTQTKTGFMLGRNNEPTIYYKKTFMFQDIENEHSENEGAFDIVQFAKCISKAKKRNRSMSVQFKTVYLDEVSIAVKQPLKQQKTLPFLSIQS